MSKESGEKILILLFCHSFFTEDIVLQDAPNGAEAVFPSNFFTFFVSSAIIADANFINPTFGFGDFSGNFWFKTKAIFLDINFFYDIAPKGFVACFHIAKIEIGKNI